jgi:radical SAM protein with 4Fe4S-binding SPASM domain
MNLPLFLLSKTAKAIRRERWIRQGRILTATFGMTYKCNLRCTTCGVWVRGETDKEVELTTEEILATARQLRDLRVPQVVLVGSEPLLRRDSLDVIEGMRGLGLEVDVITNGTMFTENLSERLVRAGVQAVTVSIDGVGERHNVIRGQVKAYERAMAGMERLAEVKKRLGSDRPKLAIHATISALNTDVLEEISNLSETLGVEVSFQLASETTVDEVQSSRLEGAVVAGDEFVSRDGTFLPDPEGVKRIRAFLKKPGVLKRHPSLAILTSMSDDDLLHGRFPVHTCHVVEGEILIDPYGEVRPCSHLEQYSYGNVKQTPVAEIWRGMRRRKLLDKVRTDMFPICDKCCQHRSNLTVWQKGRMMLKGLYG